MKKYQVECSEIKTVTFEVEANSKKEAKEKVEEIIRKTKILNINQVYKKLNYKFDVNKVKDIT